MTATQAREKRVAVERIVGFAKRYGEDALNLACHGAFPLVLTPDLLYQIWANFVPQAPWTGVARVLLSPLCREVGFEIYEMDLAVRNLLLRELQEQFGKQRFEELAEFLQEYVLQRLNSEDPDIQDIAQAQNWTALAYTKPGEAARELAQALVERLQQQDKAEVFRLTSLVETFAQPLVEAGFQPLLVYAGGVKSYVRGDLERAKEQFKLLRTGVSQAQIAGVPLSIPLSIPPQPLTHKRVALVVGINNYLWMDELRTPANDANAIAQKLIDFGFHVTGLPCASSQETWRVDSEKPLLTHELEDAITNLFALNANASIPETALLFFAGHGLRKVQGTLAEGFLATSQVDLKESWGFSLQRLRRMLDKSPVKQQIVILDCSHAGELLNFDEADPGDGETISRCFIAACREFEQAYEPTNGEHSLLTEALLQGLQQEGIISNVTLSKAIEAALRTRNQTPIYQNWGEIVLRDSGVEPRTGESQLTIPQNLVGDRKSPQPLLTHKRVALVVGINDYQFLDELRTPANDANAIAQKLIDFGFHVTGLPCASSQETWRVDSEKPLLTYELEDAITNLFALNANASIPETALLFFAGHGLRKVQGTLAEGFLATSRVDFKEIWGFSLQRLRRILAKSPVKQQIVILDCCHPGELLNFDEADPGDGETISRCFIAACREFEPAYEPTTGEHSVLTEALLQGLQQEGIISNLTLSNAIAAALQTRNQTPFCHNWGEIVLRDPGVELPEAILQDECPYKGLEAFQERDAKYFFGREKLTQTLVQRLRDRQFLAVLGHSGSGKSSVVRAGLIPELKQGSILSESKTWKIYDPFKPGDDPLASLARVLVDQNQSIERVTAELAQGAEGLQRLISQTNAPCLLVVDQFEQVFTQCQDRAKREQFFDCLLGAIGTGQGSAMFLKVIITMRADFLGECAEYPQLAKLIQTHHQIVTAMTEAELREAISKPAQTVNWNIPPDLENLMVADVQKAPGSLPLLQDILQQLWERRRQRLSIQTYQEMGSVQYALQRRANQLYQSLTEEQQTIAKRIFLELTQLVESSTPTARQVRKSQLTDLPPSPKQVETVLDRLEAARLIVTRERQDRGNKADKITVVDMAHESLISNWQQLKQWINENPELKRQRDEIEAQVQVWLDWGKPRNPGNLLRGIRLAESEAFLKRYPEYLSSLAIELIQLSIEARERTGIKRIISNFADFFKSKEE